MLDFDEKRINKSIHKYKKIMEMINQKDPFDDEEFRKLFNGFYRIFDFYSLIRRVLFCFVTYNDETLSMIEKNKKLIHYRYNFNRSLG